MSNPQTALAPANRKDIKDWLQSPAMVAEITKVLPKHITGERMLRVMLTCFLKTPKLAECSRESLTQALMTCSQAGLEPDGRLAHLIPYGNVCQVIFDWKGLVALAMRNGFESVFPDVVREHDDFEAWMENGVKKIRHKVDWTKPRGEVVAVYCVTMLKGVLDYEILSREESDDLRERSKTKDRGPWVTDETEMRKKGPIRRMSKRWDLLPEIRDVILAEDDLPADIQQTRPAMARPLFSLPDRSTAPEPGNQIPGAETFDQPSTEGGPKAEAAALPSQEPKRPGNGGATKPAGEPATEKSGGFNPVKFLRARLRDESIDEPELMAFIAASVPDGDSFPTLEDVPSGSLKLLCDRWITHKVGDAIKAARAGEGDLNV